MTTEQATISQLREPRALPKRFLLGAGDQAIVSGATFVSSVLVGRVAGATELGTFALGMSLVYVAMSIQDATISSSYIIHSRLLDERTRREYAGSTLLQSLVLAALTSMLVTAVMLGLERTWEGTRLVGLAAVGVLIGPTILGRQFARKMAFAERDVGRALLLDGVAAVLQVGGLIALATLGGLDSLTAFLTTILACGVAASIWWIQARQEILIGLGNCQRDLARTLTQGKWILAGRLVSSSHRYSAMWLVGVLSQPQDVGVLAAAMSIVAASNIIIFGLGNVVEPLVAQAYSQDGARAVKQIEAPITAALTLLMGIFALVMYLVGGEIMGWFYAGAEFQNQTGTVTVLAVALWAESVSLLAGFSLRVLHRAELNLRANVLAAVTTLVLAVPLVSAAGILGAAYAILGGQLAGSAQRCWAYQQALREAT